MAQWGILFSLAAALVLPLAAALVWSRKNGTVRPVFLGAATFFIFQVLTRIPLIQAVLPSYPWYSIFMATRPVLYLLLLSLSAGIFEEAGRYIMMKRFMEKSPISHSIGFGIGHGGIEAILLVGIPLLVLVTQNDSIVPGVPAASFFLSGVERLFAMTAHIGLSVMVFASRKARRRRLLFLAIFLHGLMNFSAVYLLQRGVSLYLVEGVVGLFAAGFLLYTRHERTMKRRNDLEKTDA